MSKASRSFIARGAVEGPAVFSPPHLLLLPLKLRLLPLKLPLLVLVPLPFVVEVEVAIEVAIVVVFAVAARYSEASASRLKQPPRSGLRSAEGRSEAQRAQRQIDCSPPKSANPPNRSKTACQALTPSALQFKPNKIKDFRTKNKSRKAAKQFPSIR
jgi:hypothetical protein